MNSKKTLFAFVLALALLVFPAAAQADFGLLPGSVSITAYNKDGTIDTKAGSHPFSFVVHFDLKTVNGESEGGEMRNAIVDLPPGFVGNPHAIPACTQQLFEGGSPKCSSSTQVGLLQARIPSVGETTGPLYNLTATPGSATRFGYDTSGLISLQYASVRSEEGYGLRVAAPDIPTEATSVTETIWGAPADEGHTVQRGPEAQGGVKSDAPFNAYLTMPASCGEVPQATVRVDSKQAPGVFSEETVPFRDAAGNPVAMSGCDAVPFDPKISSQASTRLGSTPSGLDFELKLPNQGLIAPGDTAETEPRKVVVTLPEGMTVNPSLAEGVEVCSPAQFKSEQLGTPPGAGCPEASKLGSAVATSPLLEEPFEGSLYLAAPYENPFGTLAALYLVVRVPERGVIVKQAGKIEFDQATGQITTTFDNLPPLPYSTFKLHFREGARAPLASPKACGEYTTTAKLTPFSAADDSQALTRAASFQIEHGPAGGQCPSGGLPPFRPGLIAGSLNNAAGRFSPFDVRLSRTDSEQDIERFSIKLPPGVTGKLAGVPFCPEADIAAAAARTGPHGGQEELEAPSCPKASEVGRSLVGAGVGSALAYAPGKLYLAGPYHGSALSLVAITAAKVGPFDLGTVVIRYAFKIDPETAEVFIDSTYSDAIPHIIKGVPTHLRDIRAYTDRPEFVLNPTNCKRTSTASTLLGAGLDFASEADDRPVTISTPYQAADCAALPFKPRLALKLKGGTRRGSHPALTASLEMNGIGEAGIHRTEVVLPKSEFIENAHFNTICTRVIFKAGAHPGEMCPAGSVYGKAVIRTPLLSEPLVGPVFLRSSEHQLPDVVAAVHNGEIDITLDGHVDSVKGRLRTTFEATPDAPVGSAVISLLGGKKGLFVNSTNLCRGAHKAEANFTGQNGKLSELRPALRPLGCKAKKQKRSKHKAK